VFDEAVNYTIQLSKKDDLIFGEPRTINYISFVTNRKIVGNFLDSDLKHINFEGRERVINIIRTAKPKLIIADKNYEDFYHSFEEDYEEIKEWNIPGYYHLILMKAK
jgi:hypothetical protein